MVCDREHALCVFVAGCVVGVKNRKINELEWKRLVDQGNLWTLGSVSLWLTVSLSLSALSIHSYWGLQMEVIHQSTSYQQPQAWLPWNSLWISPCSPESPDKSPIVSDDPLSVCWSPVSYRLTTTRGGLQPPFTAGGRYDCKVLSLLSHPHYNRGCVHPSKHRRTDTNLTTYKC